VRSHTVVRSPRSSPADTNGVLSLLLFSGRRSITFSPLEEEIGRKEEEKESQCIPLEIAHLVSAASLLRIYGSYSMPL
jgi:hypothetical protein